jgi:hypothetical protein
MCGPYRRKVMRQSTANYLKAAVIVLAALIAVGLGIMTTWLY